MNYKPIIFLFLLITGFGCNNNKTNTYSSQSITKKQDTIQKKETQNGINPARKQVIDDDIADSIRAEGLLKTALDIANKEKAKASFQLHSDTLDIKYGNLFSAKHKHLLIKRRCPINVYIDIYLLQNDSLKNILSFSDGELIFLDDTIEDVNGDNHPDYLVHWYPSAGCCTRDVYEVYQQESDGDFADPIEFINPHFSPKEKIVRGLCYGHDAPLYKFKWNNFSIDTVEYIYFPDSTNGNHYIRRKNEYDKGKIIKGLPAEYKNIGYGEI